MKKAAENKAKTATVLFSSVTFEKVFTLGVFTISYFFAYRFGMSFTQKLGSPFWFPDSVLLCGLLLTKPRNWWPLILATLPVRFLTSVSDHTPVWFLAACFLNDSAKGLLSAWLLRSDSERREWFDSPKHFTKYFLFAVTLLPALSATAGALSRLAFGNSFWPTWGTWFMGDSLASLVVTPGLIGLVLGFRELTSYRPRVYLEIALVAAGLVTTTYYSFFSDPGLISRYPFILYLEGPLLLWAAMRSGLFGISASLSLVGSMFIVGVASGTGPLRNTSLASEMFSMQLLLFVLSVPFIFLSVKIQQQRKTESALRESEARFRSLIDAAPVMVWMTGENARCTFFNKPWLEFTGRSYDKELGKMWTDCVHPNDRERCIREYLEAFQERKGFTFEYRLLHGNKGFRWVLGNGVPRYSLDGSFLGYIGSCVDITTRKQAEEKLRLMGVQLISAQETERLRIGQELHDDLAQRLAALSIKLSLLAQTDGARTELSGELEEVQKETLAICKDVASLSQQLRPPSLERLGLALALRDLCERSSDGNRQVSCSMIEDFPSLTEAVSVSLYRVAQEALWNAQTHSGASQIHIELKVENSILVLSIVDDGCGFSVDSSVNNGYGLPTMAERMRVIGGSLTVASNSGIGTTITAILPLKDKQPMFSLSRHPA